MNRTGRGHPKTAEYCFISPEGKEYRGTNVRKFARSQGLDAANMAHVHLGDRPHHKGWKSASHLTGR